MQTDNEILLTASGLKKIEHELEELRSVHRKRVADRIRDSKQFGEFAENSEYEDAKTEQAFVEGRIEELKQVLMHASVIDESDVMTDVVGVGSIVKVRDMENNDEWEFTIVGSIEADPAVDKISNESPVGESLMGRKVGDISEVEIPAGLARYQIVSIRK
jgi:transcription elongation factor GreA